MSTITDESAGNQPDADAGTLICVACGQRLSGGEACPECGLPLAQSRAQARLADAHVVEIQRLAWAAGMLAIFSLATLITDVCRLLAIRFHVDSDLIYDVGRSNWWELVTSAAMLSAAGLLIAARNAIAHRMPLLLARVSVGVLIASGATGMIFFLAYQMELPTPARAADFLFVVKQLADSAGVVLMLYGGLRLAYVLQRGRLAPWIAVAMAGAGLGFLFVLGGYLPEQTAWLPGAFWMLKWYLPTVVDIMATGVFAVLALALHQVAPVRR